MTRSQRGKLPTILPVLALVGLVAVLVFLPSEGSKAADRAAAVTADGAPRRIELPDGRMLQLSGRPSAVLPAAAGSVDVLVALLDPVDLAGMPAQARRYSGLRNPRSPYLALPSFAAYEAERVLALQPDLVFAHEWQSPDTTARLREAGVEVVVLDDPTDWEGVAAQMRLLGQILGGDAQERAEQLLADYELRIAALREQHPPEPLGALAYSNGGAGSVAGADTSVDEILRLAGLRNLAGEAGRSGYSGLSFEELIVIDPDVFVVGGEADAQGVGGTAAVLRCEPALAGLSAVVDDRIVVLEPWLYTTLSHHMVDAAEEVAAQTQRWAPTTPQR